MMRLIPWLSSFALAGVVAYSIHPADRVAPVVRADPEVSAAGLSIARLVHPTLPAETLIEVTLETRLSSEGASRGDVWIGSIRRPVLEEGVIVVPAGSAATGTIADAGGARDGESAWLDLALASITIGDHCYPAHGTAAAVVAHPREAQGRPVILKPGTPLSFRLDETLAIRQP